MCAVRVGSAHVPMVFSKAGNYAVDGGKQKTAFSAGTVYFRHGAKSEPGNSDDLRQFLDREVEAIRKSWMENIAKVVEAPKGSRVQILPPDAPPQQHSGAIRLVADPSAPAVYNVPIDVTHPHRQKEVVQLVNQAIGDRKKVIPFHVQCVRGAHDIDANPIFCYKQRYVSARFSQVFVDWIVEQFNANPSLFDDAKAQLDELKHRASTLVV